MNPDELVLAIDQGTHSSRAFIFNASGRVVASSQRPVSLDIRSTVRIEQSAEEILESVKEVVAEVGCKPGVSKQRIIAAGLATQRSSVVAWERSTGKALSKVLGWQDRRTEKLLRTMNVDAVEIGKLTGLRLSSHYGATKLRWLLLHEQAVKKGLARDDLVMGPLASYLLHHLLAADGEWVDHANASRTLLWNINERNWDRTLMRLFGVPGRILPECLPTCAEYGRLTTGDIPLMSVNGDQTAAMYAQGMPDENVLRVNMGSGAFVLLPVDDPAVCPEGLLAGISRSDEDMASYYIEGTVNGAGAAIDWAADYLEISNIEDKLANWLETVHEPPVFVNTVGGLGSPWWKSGPTPGFRGEPVSVESAMVAVLESVIFLLQVNIELLCRLNPGVQHIRVSGGLSNLDSLCQKMANLAGLTVHRSAQVEATSRGIAWLAAGAPEDWQEAGDEQLFLPRSDPLLNKRYRKLLATIA